MREPPDRKKRSGSYDVLAAFHARRFGSSWGL
jgi:hypothetical protein